MIEFGLPSTRSSHLNPHFSISAPVASSSDSSVFSVLNSRFSLFQFPFSLFRFPASVLFCVRSESHVRSPRNPTPPLRHPTPPDPQQQPLRRTLPAHPPRTPGALPELSSEAPEKHPEWYDRDARLDEASGRAVVTAAINSAGKLRCDAASARV